MKGKHYYIVGALKKEHPINFPTSSEEGIPLPLSWADGMIGVLPVFDSYETAIEYAGGKYEIQIYKIQMTEAKNEKK